MLNFWDEWSNKTQLEEKAIRSLFAAKELILKAIPTKNIVAIYVKGSLLQRELREDSDVDLVVILKDEQYLDALYDLNDKGQAFDSPLYNHNDKNSTLFEMPVQFVAYTLEELRTGKFIATRTKKPTPVSRLAGHLNSYQLIYGEPLDPQNIFSQTDREHLVSSIYVFEHIFIPNYENGKFKFSNLLKQVFWLTEDELRWSGYKPSYSWKDILNHVGVDHIVRKAYELRQAQKYSTEDEKKFIKKLKDYLKQLNKKLI